MSNRIYIRTWDKPDIDFDPAATIVFESNGVPVRAYFVDDVLKISADERVTISPEASNVFIVRSASPLDRVIARRVRKAIGKGETPAPADIRDLVEAALR